ncbi:MAG: GGDEF domain-containing protein [Polyangiaceae bacterium]|nr:GGDEF domain-containing protein [Polyangiaceae bacterium]
MPNPNGSDDSDQTDRLALSAVTGIADDAPLRATLTVLKGPKTGDVIPIREGETLIGRGIEATVQVVADGVSRRHARIAFRDGKYWVEDLGSTNGTICGGTLLEEPHELRDGDRISLGGRVILRFAREGELEESLRYHLYELATRDALTQAYNRRHFDERVGSEWPWAVRHGKTCALLMLDLDHFKAINDTYGHPAGDLVLKSVVGTIQKTVRREDVVARMGGEEFAIFCRSTNRAAAVALAERLRQRIGKTTTAWRGLSLSVTVSIGVATSDDPSVRTPADLAERADTCLYRAKQRGRDCVEAPEAEP